MHAHHTALVWKACRQVKLLLPDYLLVKWEQEFVFGTHDDEWCRKAVYDERKRENEQNDDRWWVFVVCIFVPQSAKQRCWHQIKVLLIDLFDGWSTSASATGGISTWGTSGEATWHTTGHTAWHTTWHTTWGTTSLCEFGHDWHGNLL